MDEITLQTTTSFLEKYTKIGIILPATPTIDAAAAALGMQAALRSLGKTVEVISDGAVPHKLSFLELSSQVHTLEIAPSQIVISLDTTKAQLAELSYDTLPGKVNIYLRSKEGHFLPSDVSIGPGELPFEILILCGVESPEQLGKTFSEHADLFYALPRINIDVNPHNENHGTLNLVSVTSSSISELTYHVLSSIKNEQSFLPVAATALLAGILANTDSLRSSRTTPDTFAVVADLIAAGAEYPLVVKYLFKTERLGFLKLWGRSLARLKVLEGRAAAYSVLLTTDFDKTDEKPETAKDVLAELYENVNNMITIALAAPFATGSKVALVQNAQLNVDDLVAVLGGSGVEHVKLDTGLEVVIVETPIAVEKIEQQLVDALNQAIPTQA